MSVKAYQQNQLTTENPREVERRLFSQVTGALLAARDKGHQDDDCINALDWNRRVWTTMASDCSVEGNQLTKELRAGIISLSIWVGKYTSQVMRGKETIEALIDINKTIMEGLAASVGLEAKGADSGLPMATSQNDPRQTFKNPALNGGRTNPAGLPAGQNLASDPGEVPPGEDLLPQTGQPPFGKFSTSA